MHAHQAGKEDKKTIIFCARITSFVGFLIGIFNAMALLLMPGYSLWNFILHIPLIFISLYGLVISRIVES